MRLFILLSRIWFCCVGANIAFYFQFLCEFVVAFGSVVVLHCLGAGDSVMLDVDALFKQFSFFELLMCRCVAGELRR